MYFVTSPPESLAGSRHKSLAVFPRHVASAAQSGPSPHLRNATFTTSHRVTAAQEGEKREAGGDPVTW